MIQKHFQSLVAYVRGSYARRFAAATYSIACVSFSGALAFPSYHLPIDIAVIVAGSYIESARPEFALSAASAEPSAFTFTNSAAITIPSSGASPNSIITVSGIPNTIDSAAGSIKVTIHGLSHSRPDDLAIALIGPSQCFVLHDGAGDATPMSNVTYSISDAGVVQLPNTGAWAPGTYRPANYYTGTIFNGLPSGTCTNTPGPVGPLTASLSSVFGGRDPNTGWALLVQNVGGAFAGTISGGWSLEIQATQIVPPTVTTVAANAITSTGAQLNSQVNPNGLPTDFWWRWSTTDPGTCSDTFGTSTSHVSAGSGTTATAFSANLSGLSPSTVYFYCAIAGNQAGLSFGQVLSFATPVAPLTVTVTNTNNTGAGSLRQAIIDTNAVGGDDVINFQLPPGPQTINLIGEQLSIIGTLTINGLGADRLFVNGNNLSRIFQIQPASEVRISGVSIINGSVEGPGGGVMNSATLTIDNCEIRNNNSGGGGGIYNTGHLAILNSSIITNSSSGSGAGILSLAPYESEATLTILNSTFSGNSSLGFGGAIRNNRTFGPGGFGANAAARIVSSTFSGNTSPIGGGVYNSGSVTVGNTIFKSGFGGNNLVNDGVLTSLGFNISNDGGGDFLTGTGDQINTDPQIDTLQNNGGTTATHLPLAGSPAIDKGKNFDSPPTDQLGQTRTYDSPAISNATGGDGTDIGAVEVQIVEPTPTPTPTPTPGASPTPDVSLDFGNQLVETTSPPQIVILTNTQTFPLELGTPTFVDGTQFQLTADPAGTIVQPGAQASIGFTFTPTSPGPKTDTATLIVVFEGSPVPVATVGLAGNGFGSPSMALSPTSLNFGSRQVSTTSTALNVIVTNTGDADLVLGTPTLATGTHFAVSGNPNGTVIAPGATAAVSFTFTPASTGAHTDTATIVSNAPGTAPTVSLSGIGVNLHFRTAASGDWTSVGTWQQSNDGGTTWGAATLTPTAANSDSIVVRSGHNISVSSSIAVDQVSIGSGRVSIDSGGTVTVNDGPGVDLTIESLDLNSRLDLEQGGSLINNGQLHVNGWFYRFGGSTLSGNSFVYSFPSILSYAFGTQTTTDIEFPETNPPSGVEVVDAEITLHAPRTLFQVALGGTGSFNIGSNLTMQDGAFVFRTSADSVFNGTPTYAGDVSLTYQNEDITTGSEAINAIGGLRVQGVDVTLGSDVTVNHGIQFDSGRVITGVHTISLLNGVNVLNGSEPGWVVGNFRKTFVSNSLVPSDRTFEVGTANGYSPVTVTFGAIGTYQQTVQAVQGAHPNVSDPTKALARHWTLSNITPGSIAADVTFKYLDADVPVTANESNFVIQKFSGGFTQPGGSIDTVANTATITGVSSFSDWTLADMGAIGTAPSVTTDAASSVTGTTATLNGSANPNGGATTGWFRYSLSDPGTCNDSFGIRAPAAGGIDLGSGNVPVTFSQDLTGLMPDATVYYCAIAQNATGTSFGSVQSFTPQFVAATVTTNAATSVVGTSATLNGTGNPNGSSATGWFRYSTTNPGTCNDVFGTRAPSTGGSDLGAGNTDVPFSQGISNLAAGTTYFFCAIAQNSGGTAFGAVLQFTTQAGVPSVTTSSETSVTATGATLNGQSNPNGGAATAWFRYSTTNPITCADTFGTRAPSSGGTSLGAGNGNVMFSQAITGLAAGTRYYFCGIVENNAGTGFGAVRSFVTSPISPTVTTSAASSVTALSATLNGSANANGSPTTGWFRYATVNPGTCNDTFGTRAPTTGGQSIGNGTSVAPLTQSIGGLTGSTTYYVCAIAGNAVGTGFGSVMSFTTPALNAFLSVTPSNLGFGNQLVGTSSSPQGVVIRNEGTDPLVLGTLTFENGTEFSFSENPSGQTLAPGQSVSASVVFTPNSEALFDDVLSIPSNAHDALTVALQGAGVNPDIAVDPTSLDFGTVSTAMGATRQVLVSNTGSADLEFTGVVEGTNAADFTTSLGVQFILPPGASAQIVVFFNPTGTGTRTASFFIGSNDPDEAIVRVDLTGIGINPGFLQFSSASYSGNEGDGTIALTVQRVGGSQGAVSAFFGATGGLATGGEACGGGVDYVNQIPFANFADGDTEPKTVLITVCDDAIVENSETFDVRLFSEDADIGSNTQAVVAISDNDVAGQISISGTIVNADNSPLAGHSVSLAGSSTGTTSTDGSGAFTFTDVTSGSYIVTPASDPSLLFDPVSRNYPNRTTNVTDANFTAYAPGTQPRTLTIQNGFATPGQQALVPIVLQSQGNEAGLTFSLDYDETLLSGASVECGTGAGAGCSLTVNTDTPGLIGISVDPVAATFAAGSREVVRVLFFTSPTASVPSTPLYFANTPAVLEISDGDANPLLTRYVAGSIVFIHGIESDVAPRPNGDGVVTSVDVAQVRRLAVGLDTFDPENNEFQRADSSPYATAGDGVVAATDITQARRYQIGSDPTQPAGGPGAPASFASVVEIERSAALASLQAPRVVRVVDAFAGRGSQVTVALRVDAEGDENVYGFSLNYDPAILTNPIVTIGADATGGNVLANTTQSGRIGFSIDFGSGAMPAGAARELVKVRFDVSPTANPGQTPLEFADAPAFRETSNSGAQALETTYANGIVTILAPTAADASLSGRVMDARGAAIRGVAVTVHDVNGGMRIFYTNSFGYYSFTGLRAGETYFVSVSARRYTFASPTQTVSLGDNVADLNFIASP